MWFCERCGTSTPKECSCRKSDPSSRAPRVRGETLSDEQLAKLANHYAGLAKSHTALRGDTISALRELQALRSQPVTPHQDVEELVAAAKAQMHGWSWPIPKAVHDLVSALARVPHVPQPVADIYPDDVLMRMAQMQSSSQKAADRVYETLRIVRDVCLARVPAPAAQAREAVAAWMTAHGIATGHGDTLEDLLVAIDQHLAAAQARSAGSVDNLDRLVEKWREDAETVEAMGYSQQADRIRDCVTELLAALQRARETGA